MPRLDEALDRCSFSMTPFSRELRTILDAFEDSLRERYGLKSALKITQTHPPQPEPNYAGTTAPGAFPAMAEGVRDEVDNA